MQMHEKMIAEISSRIDVTGLLATFGLAPMPYASGALDHTHDADINLPGRSAPLLFGSHERLVGRPDQLFPQARASDEPHRRTSVTDDWLKMIDTLRRFGIKGQVAGINTYLNNCERIDEIAYYAKVKRWATPALYFSNDYGCTDVAIAKYVSLRRLGFHPNRLRLVWIHDEDDHSDHTVLTVELDSQTFVLNDCYADIDTDTAYPEVHAVCSLNGRRFSLHWRPSDPDGVTAVLDRLVRRFCIANA